VSSAKSLTFSPGRSREMSFYMQQKSGPNVDPYSTQVKQEDTLLITVYSWLIGCYM